MAARPFFCPACQKPLGTLTRWAYRGKVHAKLRITVRAVTVEKNWRGTHVHCPCGKRIRISDDIEVIVR